jgi:hypothetical protein
MASVGSLKSARVRVSLGLSLGIANGFKPHGLQAESDVLTLANSPCSDDFATATAECDFSAIDVDVFRETNEAPIDRFLASLQLFDVIV